MLECVVSNDPPNHPIDWWLGGSSSHKVRFCVGINLISFRCNQNHFPTVNHSAINGNQAASRISRTEMISFIAS